MLLYLLFKSREPRVYLSQIPLYTLFLININKIETDTKIRGQVVQVVFVYFSGIYIDNDVYVVQNWDNQYYY